MARRKERLLTELYDATEIIKEPKITPVFNGSYRMQGPVDETYDDYKRNTVSSRLDKEVSRHTSGQNFFVRVDSGTCNVCSAPCTSCFHIKHSLMRSKHYESFDGTSRENASCSAYDAVPTVKNKKGETGLSTASETSNVVSVNSSHDSFSENVESKASLRSDVSGASPNVEMSQKFLTVGTVKGGIRTPRPHKRNSDNSNLKNKFENLEGHDDNISCLSRANEAEKSSTSGFGEKSASHTPDDDQDRKIGFVGGNSGSSLQDYSKLEAETENIASNLPVETLNSVKQIQEVEKVSDKDLLVLPDADETSMRTHSVNESDECDIVVADVKVCDICGDAGREDLLVVCCRCSDGAEHIYCTKGMMDEIPEDDWVCKDCEEEMSNQSEDKHVPVDGKDSDILGNKTDKDYSSVKLSRKRNADDAEVSSVAKRQALEPAIGSPKISSPKKIGLLSRDDSFKNLDREKVKSAHQFPHGTHIVNDTAETLAPSLGARLQTPRGAFSKSNSFSTANAKPKVKLVDEVALQRQKSMREPASLDTKEGASRVMSKSMSFKSVNSGRIGSGESTVKMLSPKFSHITDLKGLKHTKDRTFVERKNSFKSERPLISPTSTSAALPSPRVDKKPAARGDTVPFSSISNNREPKVVPSDSKLVQSSRLVNHIGRKGSEMPLPFLGEGKRQLSLSAGGGSITEQKPILDRIKDSSSTNFLIADRPSCKINDSAPDGLLRSRGLTIVAENLKDASNSHPRQSVAAVERSIPCPKCKDIGHSAESCTIDRPQQSLTSDISSLRSLKEAMDKGNRLKAAIEAAMLKRPGIYRRNKVQDQSDGVSASSISCEVPSQDQLSNSGNPRKLISVEDVSDPESAWNSNTEYAMQNTGTNENKLVTVTSSTGNCRSVVPADGKPIMDIPGHTFLETSSMLIMSAIPEHEYIWQGCFEVHSNRSSPDLYDGFQGHLSTYASHRVVETMDKFPSKVLLNEVPRLSTWPLQFEESGAKDHHIALYFFARDHESYEKWYKILLEGMLRNDLALIGNIDGVEILIFPSNQLPAKSQRWNTMLFLWGVFRGRSVSCSQNVTGSPKKLSNPRDIPKAIMSSSENICTLGPIDNADFKFNRACNVASDTHTLSDFPCSSTKPVDGDNDTKVVSLFQNGEYARLNVEQPEHRLDCNLLPSLQTTLQQSRTTKNSLEGHVDFDCKMKTESQASVPVSRSSDGSYTKNEKIPSHSDTSAERRAGDHHFSACLDSVQEMASLRSVADENIPDTMAADKDQLIVRNLKAEGSSEAETVINTERMRVPSPKELDNWHLNQRKRSYFDSSLSNSEGVFTGSNRTGIWNGEGSPSKKGKLDYNDLNGFTNGTSSPRDRAMVNGVASSSAIKKNRWDEVGEETSVSKSSGNAERYFFPVDPYPGTGVVLDNIPMPRLGVFLKNEEPFQDKVPNLELALGAEMNPPPRQSLPPFLVPKVEKNVNHNQPRGRETSKTADDDVSASLSLSLSFPSSDQDRAVQPVTKADQLLSRKVNPSPLFGGFSK